MASTLAQLLLPISLFLIMFGLGLNLKATSFTPFLKRPSFLVVGLAAQLLMLPLLALIIVSLFKPLPELAVGLMILSFAPGGATSNLLTNLAGGDTAYSISLTTVTSLVTPFTMPLFTYWALEEILGTDQALDFPVLEVMVKLFVITVLPVVLGILINQQSSNIAGVLKRFMKPLSVILFLIMVVFITYRSWEQIEMHMAQLAPVCLLLCCVAMMVGYGSSKIAGMALERRVTLTVEVGIQNAGTALLMTMGVLNSPLMSVSPLLYGIVMQIPALLLVFYCSKRIEAAKTEAAA